MPVASDRRPWVALVFVALAASCKPTAPPDAAVPDDLAQIEAELQHSAARLESAGVVVASRDPARADEAPAAPPTAESPIESPSEPSPEPSDASEPEPVEEPGATATTEQSEPPRLTPQRERKSGRKRGTKVTRDERRLAKGQRTRCERVCELTDTTCGLRDRVCELADRHADDVRYEDACRRAGDQCEAATRACESCAA